MEEEYNYYPLTLKVEQNKEEPQYNTNSEVLNSSNIVPSPNGTIMSGGTMQSPNFSKDNSGWKIDSMGNAEFNDGTFRGTFNIGGTTITINNTEDIQTNLDIISTAGGGTLYLQNGTYTLTSDISIPSGVALQGVSRDGVIINCNSSYAVKIAGTNVYSTGTVTINNGATALVGSGTTWTSDMVGRYVNLDGLWYEITAFTDTTHLTIDTYEGDNLAGSAYVLASTNFTSYLSKLTITGATSSAVIIQYAQEPYLFDLSIYGNGTGIDSDYTTYLQMNTINCNSNGVNLDMNFTEGFYIDWSDFSTSTTGAGVVMTNYTRNATFFNTSVADNTGNGISVTLGSKIAFISLDISGNGGKGIEFIANNSNNSISDTTLDGNTSDGIKLTATTDLTQIIGVGIINSGGYGINIAAATCDSNQIIAPAFSNNTSGNINDTGTLTVLVADDTAYGASWNGNVGVATKNTIYDKIETLGGGTTYASGATTRDISTASSTQTIAHGLGVTPSIVKISGTLVRSGSISMANTVYTNAQASNYLYGDTGTSTNEGAGATFSLGAINAGDYAGGVVTVDATNISIAWTKNGSATGTAYLVWEAST